MSTQSVTTPHGAGTSTDAEVSHTPTFKTLQIANFLRTNFTYDRRNAYGVILHKVPNLDSLTQRRIRDFVKERTIPSRGLVSNPRVFLSDHLVDVEEVYQLSYTDI